MPDGGGQAPAKRSRGVGSVETGLRVLRAMAEATDGPAPLSAVARASGLSAPTAHRYLASLVASGFVRQDAATGRYDLDAGALRVGLAALARLDPFARAEAAFRAVAEATGRTVMLSVMGDAGATVVRWFPGRPPVLTSLGVGSVMPRDASATGRVFAAFGDAPEPRPEAEAIRADLIARVDGGLIPGLRADAVPVFDLQGRLALVATGIATDATPRAGDEAARLALRDAARAVTEALGGRWPDAPRGGTRGPDG